MLYPQTEEVWKDETRLSVWRDLAEPLGVYVSCSVTLGRPFVNACPIVGHAYEFRTLSASSYWVSELDWERMSAEEQLITTQNVIRGRNIHGEGSCREFAFQEEVFEQWADAKRTISKQDTFSLRWAT